MKAFQAKPASTKSISVASSSDKVAVSTAGCNAIRVMNNGTATAWVKFGADSTVAATVADDFPVGPGVTEVFTFGAEAATVYAAAIAAGSTGSIYFTPGNGI